MIKVTSEQNPGLTIGGETIETIVLGSDASALLAALKAEQYAAEALASKNAAALSEKNSKNSELNSDANAKAAALSEKNSKANAEDAAVSEQHSNNSALAAADSEKNAEASAKAAAGSEANADASAKAAAGSEANAAGSANEATKQANLAKQYKEEMFNGTPDGYAEYIDKVDALVEESIGTFRAINGKIHIKTA